MKRIVFLLIILCLLPCSALASDGDLPDMEAFSNGLVKIDMSGTEELDYATKKMYCGTDEDVRFVAAEYIKLLTEKYGMAEICHFQLSDGDAVRVRCAFNYTKSEPKINTSSIWNDNEGWRINNLHVLIEYSQSDYYEGEYILINYAPALNYIDTGDRIAPAAKASAVPSVQPTAEPEECPECDGTGECQECGGDMWVWGYEWEYINGSPESVRKNRMCDAIYCYGGSCDKCGGDGVL